MIKRDSYLNKLIASKDNKMVKIITGIRRCGKSTLLFDIYYNYLLSINIAKEQIIKIQLDDISQIKYRNPIVLCDYIYSITEKNRDKQYYVFIDEVQYIEKTKVENLLEPVGLYEALNSLNHQQNIDVYVTGSNSKMLSTDIATEFRGRGYEIRVHPLSYKEYYDSLENDFEKMQAFNTFLMFGGMPQLTMFGDNEKKIDYLKSLISNVYIKDIIERNKIKKQATEVGELLDCISSSIGSLTSSKKLADTFNTIKQLKITPSTVDSYLTAFEDSFLVHKARRFDIKGKSYINSPAKYYFEDVGLRNARLGFKEQDVTHIMENIIYNELVIRGFNVDVGIVEHFAKNSENKTQRVNYEIDFVCNKGNERYYIQSAYAIPTLEKIEQETRGFSLIDDSYKKIVVVRDRIIPWTDEKGIKYIGIEEFLLNKTTTD